MNKVRRGRGVEAKIQIPQGPRRHFEVAGGGG